MEIMEQLGTTCNKQQKIQKLKTLIHLLIIGDRIGSLWHLVLLLPARRLRTQDLASSTCRFLAVAACC